AQVQQNLLLALAKMLADLVAQHNAAFAEGNASTEIHDGDAVNAPAIRFHRHCVSSAAAPEGWPVCLTSVISVPGSKFRIRTSSINDRIRKMPRPDCFSRFSSAS